MQIAWIFLKIFKDYFLQGNFKKAMKKKPLKKQFSIKMLAWF